jgi:hypothetical protein
MSLYAQDIQVFVQSPKEHFSMCNTTNFLELRFSWNHAHFQNHDYIFGTMLIFLEPHLLFLVLFLVLIFFEFFIHFLGSTLPYFIHFLGSPSPLSPLPILSIFLVLFAGLPPHSPYPHILPTSASPYSPPLPTWYFSHPPHSSLSYLTILSDPSSLLYFRTYTPPSPCIPSPLILLSPPSRPSSSLVQFSFLNIYLIPSPFFNMNQSHHDTC